MTAREFEEALAWLCRRDGCLEAYVSGKAGDLGADVQAITPDGRLLVIQAKRYVPGNMVTGPALQKFGGTCYNVHGADVAAVVTTSGFTQQAREYAAATGIALFDNDALAGWAARNGPPPWLAVPAPPRPIAPAGPEPRRQALPADVVSGLAWDAPSVHPSVAMSKLVGVGGGCHASDGAILEAQAS